MGVDFSKKQKLPQNASNCTSFASFGREESNKLMRKRSGNFSSKKSIIYIYLPFLTGGIFLIIDANTPNMHSYVESNPMGSKNTQIMLNYVLL